MQTFPKLPIKKKGDQKMICCGHSSAAVAPQAFVADDRGNSPFVDDNQRESPQSSMYSRVFTRAPRTTLTNAELKGDKIAELIEDILFIYLERIKEICDTITPEATWAEVEEKQEALKRENGFCVFQKVQNQIKLLRELRLVSWGLKGNRDLENLGNRCSVSEFQHIQRMAKETIIEASIKATMALIQIELAQGLSKIEIYSLGKMKGDCHDLLPEPDIELPLDYQLASIEEIDESESVKSESPVRLFRKRDSLPLLQLINSQCQQLKEKLLKLIGEESEFSEESLSRTGDQDEEEWEDILLYYTNLPIRRAFQVVTSTNGSEDLRRNAEICKQMLEMADRTAKCAEQYLSEASTIKDTADFGTLIRSWRTGTPYR